MERGFAVGDLPWAARRLARKATIAAMPIRAHLELAVLRARLSARLSRLADPVRENLESTLGRDPAFDLERIARRYHEFACVHGLVGSLPAIRGFGDPGRWPLVGREHLDAALAGGRGALLCTAHLGWWLLVAPILRVHGYDLVRTGGPFFDRQRSREESGRRKGSRFRRYVREHTRTRAVYLRPDDIAATLDVRPFFRALARNRPVLIAGDGKRSLEFAFFPLLGKPYPLPTGFVKIAMATGAPLLPVFGLERGRLGSIQVEIHPPLAIDPGAGAVENLALYARVLDEQLRRSPHLWPRWEIENLFEDRRAWAEGGYRAAGRAVGDPAAGVESEAGKLDGSRSK